MSSAVHCAPGSSVTTPPPRTDDPPRSREAQAQQRADTAEVCSESRGVQDVKAQNACQAIQRHIFRPRPVIACYTRYLRYTDERHARLICLHACRQQTDGTLVYVAPDRSVCHVAQFDIAFVSYRVAATCPPAQPSCPAAAPPPADSCFQQHRSSRFLSFSPA